MQKKKKRENKASATWGPTPESFKTLVPMHAKANLDPPTYIITFPKRGRELTILKAMCYDLQNFLLQPNFMANKENPTLTYKDRSRRLPWLLGEPKVGVLMLGTFPCGNRLSNAEGGEPGLIGHMANVWTWKKVVSWLLGEGPPTNETVVFFRFCCHQPMLLFLLVIYLLLPPSSWYGCWVQLCLSNRMLGVLFACSRPFLTSPRREPAKDTKVMIIKKGWRELQTDGTRETLYSWRCSRLREMFGESTTKQWKL